MTRAIVIGAGFGGLAAALRLQGAGIDTTLVERADRVGGKARNLVVDNVPVPGGPTVLTMRSIFEDLFQAVGDTLAEHVTLSPLVHLAHHRWSASERLDLYQSVDRSADAIAAFAGPAEADGYRRFVADAALAFQTVEHPFIRSAKPDLLALARSAGPSGALRIRPFQTLWAALGSYFKDPRLRQLFGRYATYVGASPFAAPATLMLVAHVEQAGVDTLEGGLAALAEAIAARFKAKGGTVLTGAEAGAIAATRKGVEGVEIAGERLPADIVVVNADASALGAGHFGAAVAKAAPQVRAKERSLSAVAICANFTFQEPVHYHNVFFGRDYEAEFKALVGDRRLPDDPTVYICAPKAQGTAPGLPQPGLVVLNAPATGDNAGTWTEEDVARCKAQVMAALDRCGLQARMLSDVTTTPAGFHAMLPATGGAIYGRASHGWTASFQRPGIRTKIPGLYLAGGSVHPGPGAPMATLSGHLAADQALSDFDLPSRSDRAATSGGTSTVSARTANTR